MAVAVAATAGGRASDVCAVYIYYICTIEARKEKRTKRTQPRTERTRRITANSSQLNTMALMVVRMSRNIY